MGPEIGDVAVDECDEITLGLPQCDPHGLALAAARGLATDDPGTRPAGDRPGVVGGAVVDDQDLVDEGDPSAFGGQSGDDAQDDGTDRRRLVPGRDADGHGTAGLGTGQVCRVEVAMGEHPRKLVVRDPYWHPSIFAHRPAGRRGHRIPASVGGVTDRAGCDHVDASRRSWPTMDPIIQSS
jgi:hypothetical protein